jgi:NAD(P)H-hydrate epimerase
MKILKAAEMAEVDRLTTEVYGIPSILLMESAGRSVIDELAGVFPDIDRRRVLVLCGRGNNGGDGLVAARHLISRGAHPEVLFLGDPDRLKGDALANWKMIRRLDPDLHVLAGAAERRRTLKNTEPPDVIIDAMFGTGLSKPIGPDFRFAVEWINRSAARSFVTAVDIPSGLMADSSQIPGPVVRAHLTVTFTAPKPALLLHPAAAAAGRVVRVHIGSPHDLISEEKYRLEWVDEALVRGTLPRRDRDSHKGHFGHIFVLAGSRGKSGAAIMTGLAALRSGAGLVTLMLPESLEKDVFGRVPELMTEYLPQTASGAMDVSGREKILGFLEAAQTVVIGPGMGAAASTQNLIRAIVRRAPVPVVLDADGLNAFAHRTSQLRNEEGNPIVITPHPGEMARLIGVRIPKIQRCRLETAGRFAEETGCYTVLKGYQTVLGTPCGRILVNSTGNPGMATGGSGDILSGMVGRFVAGWFRNRRRSPVRLEEHVAAAVFLHGWAGDIAAEKRGEESLIATDMLPCLPEAFKRLRKP